jgi:hypothetical protein
LFKKLAADGPQQLSTAVHRWHSPFRASNRPRREGATPIQRGFNASLRSRCDPALPRAWLSGYYNAKRNNLMVDLQTLEENATKVQNYCYDEKNFKVPVMKAVSGVSSNPKQNSDRALTIHLLG